MDDNSESDADKDGEVADPEDVVVNDVDVPAVDNPLQDNEPNIIEDPDDTSEVESEDNDDSSEVQLDTSYYFDNNESTQSDNNNTPPPLKSALDGPY